MLTWEFINKYRIGICVGLTLLALLFIVVGHKYRDQVQTKLKKEFIKLPETTVDWWSISHILLYMIFGFLIPDKHTTFLLIGVIFEVLEDMLSSDKTTQLVNCTDSINKNNIMCKFSINTDYWYGKWDDVFMNLLGYTLGSSARNTFCKI